MATRINLHPNPALKNNTSGNGTTWTSSPSGYVRQTGVSGMSRTTGFGGTGAIDVVTSPRFAAVAGRQYMASVQVKTGASNTFALLINWYTSISGGSFISNSGSGDAFTVNGTQRCEIGPYTAPSGAVAGYLRVINLDNTSVTLTAMLVEQTNVGGNAYFDGDTTGATWSGTAGNSTSYLLTGADSWTTTDAGTKTNVAIGPTGFDGASFASVGSVVGSGTVGEVASFSDSGMVASLGYDDHRGRVRISAFGLPFGTIRALVYRRIQANVDKFAFVRGGQVSVTNGAFDRTVDDYEFPEGIDIDYLIIGQANAAGAPEIDTASAIVTQPAIRPAVWLKFMSSPWLNQKLTLIGWGDVGRSSRNAAYQVIGRSDPIVITDVASSRNVQISLRTADTDTGNALDRALSAGQPAFLHTPADVALPSMYVAIGDASYARTSSYSHVRMWTVTLTEVSAPATSIFGVATTWSNMLEIYATWSDLVEANDAWSDVNS